jgi:hypothetical protein
LLPRGNIKHVGTNLDALGEKLEFAQKEHVEGLTLMEVTGRALSILAIWTGPILL